MLAQNKVKHNLILLLCFLGAFVAAVQAQNAIFVDDFEDKYADGWAARNPSNWQVVLNEGDYSYFQSNTNLTGHSQQLNEWSIYQNKVFSDIILTCKVKTAENLTGNPLADYALIFHYQNDDNYYLAFFNAAQNETRLIRRYNGVEIILNQYRPATIVGNNYQSVTIKTTNGTIEVMADNKAIMRVYDTTFLSGKIGLGCRNDAAYFDNVIISDSRKPGSDFEDNFNDDFLDGWTAHTLSRWSTHYLAYESHALWLNTSSYNSSHEENLGEIITIDDLYLSDFTFECDLASSEYSNSTADLAFIFGYQDYDNYYYAILNRNPGSTKLVRWQNGAAYTLDTFNSGVLLDQEWHHIKVTRENGWNEVIYDDQVILEAYDNHMPIGKIGVGSKNDAGYFDNICLDFPDCHISIDSPLNGQLWYTGEVRDILWHSSHTSGNVKLEYSTNNGTNWNLIVSSTYDDGRYSWTIPHSIASVQCKVRITDIARADCYDQNDGVFSVLKSCDITISSPVGGEIWPEKSTQNITWQSSGTSGNVSLSYSLNAGASWSIITTSTTDDGHYTWTLPEVATDHVQSHIKIADAANSECYRVSNNFTILDLPCAFTLTSPNGREIWDEKTNHDILWGSQNAGNYVKLSYSLNAGASWNTITNSTVNDGIFTWTLPEVSANQTQCQVRVEDQNNAGCYDVSDNWFTIRNVELCPIQVLVPNLKVAWEIGSNHSIAWNPADKSGNVKIEYTINGGNSWVTIAAVVPDNGCYNWTVPNTPSHQCRIRVSDVFDLSCVDDSDAFFTVGPALTPYVQLGDIHGGLNQLVSCELKIGGNITPIDAFGCDLVYDPSHLAYHSLEKGTLTVNWIQVSGNQSNPGLISIGGFNTQAIPSGSLGSIAKIIFKIIVPDQPCASSHLVLQRPVDDLVGMNNFNGTFANKKLCTLGDVNRDGAITPGDALCAFNIYLYGQPIGDCDTECARYASDVNCDGQITPGDALIIFDAYLNGKIIQCPGLTRSENTLVTRVSAGSGIGIAGELFQLPIFLTEPQNVNAFGLELIYPVELLEFKGIVRTVVTESWIALNAVESSPGIITLGGFDTSVLSAETEVMVAQLQFYVKPAATGHGFFQINRKTDDVIGATIQFGSFSTRSLTALPLDYRLDQNYPNPFNPETEISFQLPEANLVRIAVYNLSSQLVKVLVDQEMAQGFHVTHWDGKNELGLDVPSGVYFYTMKSASFTATRKMTLIK